MADDNYILITARLDEVRSTAEIQKQLDKISNNIILRIHNVELTQNFVNNLNSAIKDVERNIRININDVSIDQSKTIQQAKNISKQISSAMNQGVGSSNAGSNINRAFDISNKVAKQLKVKYTDVAVLAETLQDKFKKVGTVTTEVLSHENKLIDQFRVTVTNADGAVEKLVYRLGTIKGTNKHTWEVTGATFNDNNIKLQEQAIKQAQAEAKNLNRELTSGYKTLTHNLQIMDNLSHRQIFNKNASANEVVKLQENIVAADKAFASLKQRVESQPASFELIKEVKALNSTIITTTASAHELARSLEQSQTNVVHEEEVNYLKALYNNLKASDVALDEFKADYQELNALLSQAQITGDYTQYFTQLDIFKSKFTEAKTEIQATTAATSELEKMSKSLASNKMNTFFDKNAGNVQVNALKTEISGLINEWTTLKTEIDNTGRVTHTMQTRLDDLKVRMQNATTAADMLQANIKRIADTQRLATQQQSLDTRISTWLQNNTRASAETIASLKNLQVQIHNADAQTMFNLNNQFRQITANARAAGEAGLKLSDIIKQKLGKFAGWFSIATVVMRGVNKLKEMYRTVVELDSAMVGLRKVTDETDAVYNKFFTDAAKNAKILGVSIKDIIDSTTEFARLGYSLADSQLLAQMATLYKNVGDGIDIGQATSNLISTMKAFGLSADEVESIIDKFNKVKTCPFYALVKRDRGQIFSNCWEFLKLFCLLYRRRKPETSEQIAYGEIKAFWKCEHSKRPKCGLMDSQQPSYICYRRYTDYKGIAA